MFRYHPQRRHFRRPCHRRLFHFSPFCLCGCVCFFCFVEAKADKVGNNSEPDDISPDLFRQLVIHSFNRVVRSFANGGRPALRQLSRRNAIARRQTERERQRVQPKGALRPARHNPNNKPTPAKVGWSRHPQRRRRQDTKCCCDSDSDQYPPPFHNHHHHILNLLYHERRRRRHTALPD